MTIENFKDLTNRVAAIQSYLKKRYKDRLDKFGRGLLSSEEIKSNLLSESAG